MNIGTINAFIRIACGFTLFACSIAKLTKRPWEPLWLLLSMCAGMKIASGILRYCPVTECFIDRGMEKDEYEQQY